MWSLLYTALSLFSGSPTLVPDQEATLLFAGDAMQHQAQLDTAKAIGIDDYDYTDCFTLIAPAVSEADYAVCNLEVPLGGGNDYTGYPCFSAPDSFAQSLIDAGFDMLLTANNHCLDRRGKAAIRTIDALDSMKVDHIGTYKNISMRDSLVPFIKDINGIKFGFLNYTYGTNGIEPDNGIEVAMIEPAKIKEEIELTRRKGAEFIIANLHWGIEYVLLENRIQRNLADFLIESGVDMIIGGHPHVVQPMKIMHNEKVNKDVLVVYSLGNFISNMKTADTRGGAIVWAKVKRDGEGRAVLDKAEYETIFAAKPEGNKNFRVIPGWMDDSIPASQKQHWEIFNRGATKVFDKYNVNVNRKYSKDKNIDDTSK